MSLAEMLAGKGGHEEPDGDEGEGDADPKAMVAASLKAMYDALRSGDAEAAAEHFSSALTHCKEYDEGEYGEGEGKYGHDHYDGGEYGEGEGKYGHALMILAPKGK